MRIFIIWFLILIFIIFSALFSGSETVLISSDTYKLKKKSKKGDKKAGKIMKLLSNPEKYLSTILVGNNVCIVSVGILFNNTFRNLTGISGFRLAIITTIITSIVLLIFAEIVPKTVGLVRANRFLIPASRFIKFVYYLFFPIIEIIKLISSLIGKIVNRGKQDGKTKSIFFQKGEVKSFIHKTSLIRKQEGYYINNILDYSKTTAREIMTPLIDVFSIDIGTNLDKLARILPKRGFSKIPVYEDRVDKLTGYIDVMDLLDNLDKSSIKAFIKDPFYVPETKKIGRLLLEMQRRNIPIVFVIDEYGTSSGIITNEDIAEEIVGDILFENEEKKVISKDEGKTLIVKSQTDIDDLNEWYNLGIEKKGFETIGGFVMYILGRLPKQGDNFTHKNFLYTVVDIEETTIKRITIKRL
jgi:putative hemolysin